VSCQEPIVLPAALRSANNGKAGPTFSMRSNLVGRGTAEQCDLERQCAVNKAHVNDNGE